MNCIGKKVIVMILVLTFTILAALSVSAEAANTGTNDFPTVLNGMSLSKEQNDKTVDLTKKLLKNLQDANYSISKLLAPDSKQPDPKNAAKITMVQRDFILKFKHYQLDLADTIGEEKTQQVVTVVQTVIPPLLLPNRETTGTININSNTATNGAVANMSGMSPQGTANTNSGTPVPNSQTMPGTANMSGLGMSMMPTMGIPNLNGPIVNSGNLINRQILYQIRSVNYLIRQLLSGISGLSGAELQSRYQLITQLLANQSALMKLLNAPTNNMNGMNMGK